MSSKGELLNRARSGDVEAMVEVAELYLEGETGQETGVKRDMDDVKQDVFRGLNWLEKAAETGHAWAQFRLSSILSKHDDLFGEMEKSFYWLKKAAEQGLPMAQHDLSLAYKTGKGTLIDFDKAFYWADVAVNSGSPEAKGALGLLYMTGQGVAENYEKAVQLFNAAIAEGVLEAKIYLAMSYIAGTGVPVDKQKARRLCNEALEEGQRTGDEFIIELAESVLNELIRDTSPSGKSKGCYVATCVYGSYDCPEVLMLRRFRDCTLAKTSLGRGVIFTYYTLSPRLVNAFGEAKWFKSLCKPIVNKLVCHLKHQGVSSAPYSDYQ